MRSSSGLAALVVGVTCACTQCGPATHVATPAPPVIDVQPAPVAAPAAASSASAAPSLPCEADGGSLFVFGRAPAEAAEQTPSTRLMKLVAETELVALVTAPLLAIPDCSGVGHYHTVVEATSDIPDQSWRAHASTDLSAPGAPTAAFYLAGAARKPAEPFSLKHVCINYEAAHNARLLWLLPLANEQAVAEWRLRLARQECRPTAKQ